MAQLYPYICKSPAFETLHIDWAAKHFLRAGDFCAFLALSAKEKSGEWSPFMPSCALARISPQMASSFCEQFN